MNRIGFVNYWYYWLLGACCSLTGVRESRENIQDIVVINVNENTLHIDEEPNSGMNPINRRRNNVKVILND